MSFETILKSISEETDRTTLDAMAKKYPSLREYAELGETIHNMKPRLKSLSGDGPEYDYEAHPDLAIDELEKWRVYKPKAEKMVEDVNQLRASLAEAQSRITEYEARTDTDMTPDEIKALVASTLKENGVVMTADLDKALDRYGNERVLPTINNMGNRFQEVYSTLTPRMWDHAKEYGEQLNPSDVFKYMTEHKIEDPVKAYNEWVSPKREAKLTAEHAKAVEEAKKAGMDEGRRLAAAAIGKSQPVDGKGSAMPGPLVQRWQAKMEKLKAEGKEGSAPLGTGAIAASAAREYRQKQAEGNAA